MPDEITPDARPFLMTSDEVATFLRVRPDWVRANKAALGAQRLGDGPSADLRFPRTNIDAYLEARAVTGAAPTDEPHTPPRRRRRRRLDIGDVPALQPTGTAVMDW